MGTKMGPSYACLFMGYLEHEMRQKYQGPTPELYRRYIDDGLGATSLNIEDLTKWIDFANQLYPSIQFTHNISPSSVVFLDMEISLRRHSIPLFTTNLQTRTPTSTTTLHTRPPQKKPFHLGNCYAWDAYVLMMKTSTQKHKECAISLGTATTLNTLSMQLSAVFKPYQETEPYFLAIQIKSQDLH